jgi:hypothetical protein
MAVVVVAFAAHPGIIAHAQNIATGDTNVLSAPTWMESIAQGYDS